MDNQTPVFSGLDQQVRRAVQSMRSGMGEAIAALQVAQADKVAKSGDTMAGDLDLGGNRLLGLSADDVPNLDASKVTAGTFSTSRIPNLDAGKITSGTFHSSRIPNLDASHIVSGSFHMNRMPNVWTNIIDVGSGGGQTSARIRFGDSSNGFYASQNNWIATTVDGQWRLLVENNQVRVRSNCNLRLDSHLDMYGNSSRLHIRDEALLRWPHLWDRTASVSSNVHVNSNGWFYRATSSARYKTNIETLDESTSADGVLGLRPVTFTSTCDPDDPEQSHIGLIAEEVAEHFPELVVRDDEGRPDAVEYDHLVAPIISLCQRQQRQIDEQGERIAALEAIVESLAADRGGENADF